MGHMLVHLKSMDTTSNLSVKQHWMTIVMPKTWKWFFYYAICGKNIVKNSFYLKLYIPFKIPIKTAIFCQVGHPHLTRAEFIFKFHNYDSLFDLIEYFQC